MVKCPKCACEFHVVKCPECKSDFRMDHQIDTNEECSSCDIKFSAGFASILTFIAFCFLVGGGAVADAGIVIVGLTMLTVSIVYWIDVGHTLARWDIARKK